MNRTTGLFLAMLLLITLILVPVATAQIENYNYLDTVQIFIGQKTAYVNGKSCEIDQAAYIKEGRTLIPFRFLGESLGAKVDWEDLTRTAVLQLDGINVRVTIGSNIAYVNGLPHTLDVPAENVKGRTFIPLRFASESLGAIVDWDGRYNKVAISMIDVENWSEFSGRDFYDLVYPENWILIEDPNAVNLTTPLNSELSIKISQQKASEIIAAKKQEFINEGFGLIFEQSLHTEKINSAYVLGFLSSNDDSKVVVIGIGQKEQVNIVFKMNSDISGLEKDLPVMEKILSEIE